MYAHLRIAVLPLGPNDVSAGERELLHRADPLLNSVVWIERRCDRPSADCGRH